ncbi:hypothetical protein L1887_57559 [Cichorium endivia]|nr:hypothetical protein L1887_57559 [Cichorium endivia]
MQNTALSFLFPLVTRSSEGGGVEVVQRRKLATQPQAPGACRGTADELLTRLEARWHVAPTFVWGIMTSAPSRREAENFLSRGLGASQLCIACTRARSLPSFHASSSGRFAYSHRSNYERHEQLGSGSCQGAASDARVQWVIRRASVPPPLARDRGVWSELEPARTHPAASLLHRSLRDIWKNL